MKLPAASAYAFAKRYQPCHSACSAAQARTAVRTAYAGSTCHVATCSSSRCALSTPLHQTCCQNGHARRTCAHQGRAAVQVLGPHQIAAMELACAPFRVDLPAMCASLAAQAVQVSCFPSSMHVLDHFLLACNTLRSMHGMQIMACRVEECGQLAELCKHMPLKQQLSMLQLLPLQDGAASSASTACDPFQLDELDIPEDPFQIDFVLDDNL